MNKIAIFIILISSLMVGCNDNNDIVCIDDICLTVEIADTQEKQMVGLMDRDQLDTNKGMLFVFDSSDRYTFWMKNTLIPLDIIWIDENKEIVHIEENVQPCKVDPCQTYNHEVDAKYVLETNSGFVKENNVSKGQKLTITK